METASERVRRSRRMVLELLLARAPEAEAIRDLAREYGVTEPRFAAEGGPLPNGRCILCGLCVRFCAGVGKRSALGYAGRGPKRIITPPFGRGSEECSGCKICVSGCPTKALSCEDVEGHPPGRVPLMREAFRHDKAGRGKPQAAGDVGGARLDVPTVPPEAQGIERGRSSDA